MTLEPAESQQKKTIRRQRPITDRQQAVLDFLNYYFRQQGYWPSIREILEHFKFKSTNAVQRHLRALERKGCLTRARGQARAFRAVKNSDFENNGNGDSNSAKTFDVVNIPIYGNISAGYPDRVEPGEAIGRLQIDVETAGLNRRARVKPFALRVRGDSMVDAGIFEGDTVVVEPGPGAHGDIVAALIDGETTLKRLISEMGKPAYLKAENCKYPELYPISELIIQGVARSIVRSL